MALVPIAKQGNFLHIYDFKVDPAHVDEFIRLFNQFDYSEENPMHKSPAQVKDGALVQDVKDPTRFWLIGEWAEAATVVFLFSVAQWLESRSMDRAREAIRALMDLTPDQARVRQHDREEVLPVDAIPLGAVMIIRPGEKIPLDGRVVAGRSDVNQAPITGESLPVDKGLDDEVFAGTINGHGAIEVAVTRRRRDTTLARIIHLVERAQAQRAPAGLHRSPTAARRQGAVPGLPDAAQPARYAGNSSREARFPPR